MNSFPSTSFQVIHLNHQTRQSLILDYVDTQLVPNPKSSQTADSISKSSMPMKWADGATFFDGHFCHPGRVVI